MDQEQEYLSQEKYEELAAELEDLRLMKRREVAERLEFAKSLGDLSENAEYHAAREEQAEIEERISQLENLLKHSDIISHRQGAGTMVEVGSTLTVRKEDGGEERRFTIVGSAEADTAAGKISYQSPLGASLLGGKKGDKVSVETPRGAAQYKIIKVE